MMTISRAALLDIIQVVFDDKDISLSYNELKDYLDAQRLLQYVYKKKEKEECFQPYVDIYRERYLKTLAVNKFFAQSAEVIFNEFSKRKIKGLSTKGLWLSSNIYQDYGIRPMGDIDIIVDKSQLDSAEEVLRQLGYVQGHYNRHTQIIEPASKKDIVKSKLYMHETISFVKVENQKWIYVDLAFKFSWQIGDDYPLVDFGELYENSICTNNIRFMDTYSNIIHLCCHIYDESVFFMFKHLEYKENIQDISLGKFLDIYLILQKGIDYVKLWECAEKYKAQKQVDYVFRIMKSLGVKVEMESVNGTEHNDEVNVFFDKTFRKQLWPVDIVERLRGSNEKENFIRTLY